MYRHNTTYKLGNNFRKTKLKFYRIEFPIQHRSKVPMHINPPNDIPTFSIFFPTIRTTSAPASPALNEKYERFRRTLEKNSNFDFKSYLKAFPPPQKPPIVAPIMNPIMKPAFTLSLQGAPRSCSFDTWFTGISTYNENNSINQNVVITRETCTRTSATIGK